MTGLKAELQKQLHERNESTARGNKLEHQVQELRDDIVRLKEQVNAARQTVDEYKSQLQTSKLENDSLMSRLSNKDKEIK